MRVCRSGLGWDEGDTVLQLLMMLIDGMRSPNVDAAATRGPVGLLLLCYASVMTEKKRVMLRW